MNLLILDVYMCASVYTLWKILSTPCHQGGLGGQQEEVSWSCLAWIKYGHITFAALPEK